MKYTVAPGTSERQYSFFFQINRQDPYKVDGIDLQTYIKLKNGTSFALEFAHDLMDKNLIPNFDDVIETLWKSLDGIEFEMIQNRSSSPVAFERVETQLIVSNESTSESIAPISPVDIVAHSTASTSRELDTFTSIRNKEVPRNNTKLLQPSFKKKLGKTSKVWRLFVKTSSGGTCKLCGIAVKATGNTTNLTNHITRHHADIGLNLTQTSSQDNQKTKHQCTGDSNDPDTPENVDNNTSRNKHDRALQKIPSSFKALHVDNCEPVSQPRIDTTISKISLFNDGGSKAAALTSALVYMIVKDDLPLNTTEKEGCRYFIKLGMPLYKIPGRTTLTAVLNNKYEALAESVKTKLLQATGLTLTIDVWTETMNFTSFLGCTVHFLFEGKLKSLVLNTTHLNERHTSEYLQKILLNVCIEWGIPLEKVTAVITDNGANIVKAVLTTFGPHRHMACFAHSLNLVPTRVVGASEPVKDLFTKVKTIVTFFKQSTVASDELIKSQCRNPPLHLVQDVPTRWNSSYYMLERFLDLIDTVSSVLLKLPKSPPMLSAPEVAIIRELMQILQPEESISKELSGQNYVTSSKIIPTIYCLKKAVEEINIQSPIAKNFKNELLKEFDIRFRGVELNDLIAIPTILDPRFKRLFFSSALSCAKSIEKINIILKDDKATTQSKDESEQRDLASNCENNRVWKFYAELVKNKKNYATDALEVGGLHPDLKQYLSKDTIPLQADPINFWSQQKENSPALASLALKHLSVVATSVPCERVFSMAGNIATPNRNRLSPKHLSRILFLKSLDFSDWGI